VALALWFQALAKAHLAQLSPRAPKSKARVEKNKEKIKKIS